MNSQNIQLVRDYWQKLWSEGDFDFVSEFYAPDCIHGKNFSIDGFKQNVAETRAAFPDFKVEVEDIFVADGKVVSRVTYTGTHLAALEYIQPTGKKILLTGLDIFKINDGKCTHHWHAVDHLKMMLQLGQKVVSDETKQ